MDKQAMAAGADMPRVTRARQSKGRDYDLDRRCVLMWESGMRAKEIAERLGICQVNVYRRINRVAAEQAAAAAK